MKFYKNVNENDKALTTITELCRKVKKFEVASLDELVDKCKELHNFYLTKSNPPNYDLSSFTKFTEK